jgi:hypothetical protein
MLDCAPLSTGKAWCFSRLSFCAIPNSKFPRLVNIWCLVLWRWKASQIHSCRPAISIEKLDQPEKLSLRYGGKGGAQLLCKHPDCFQSVCHIAGCFVVAISVYWDSVVRKFGNSFSRIAQFSGHFVLTAIA